MNRKRLQSLTLALGALFICGSLAQAQVTLAQWDFSSDANVTSTHTDVSSASAVSVAGGTFDNSGRSSGPGINLDGSSYTSNEPLHDANSWMGDSGRYFARGFEDASITSSTKHFAFDITLAPGVEYDLEKVWFDFGIRFDAGDQISVQMSDNSSFTSAIVLGEGESTGLEATTLGYIDDNGTTSLGITQPGNIQWFSWNRLENTLNTPVTISDTTYFRIYVAGGLETNALHEGNYIDNLTITAVPEPSTYAALFGLLALGLVVWRRRR